jgi:16S rRNA (uracil1498-N3)-methyltransferase
VRRRFFVEHFDLGSATLRGDSAEHLGRVLRAQPGQLYELSDGERVWLGRVQRVALSKRGDNRIEFALVEPLPASEPSLKIILLLALVKFDRFEWCLEKAAELGVAEIIPMAAARTDKPLIGAAHKRFTRWEKILLESAQQSRRLRAPRLIAALDGSDSSAHSAAKIPNSVRAFAETSAGSKIILSERREAAPFREILAAPALKAPTLRSGSVALGIGPEGGWTDEELAAARAAGFAEASLSQNILRTETAALAAIATLQFALGGS